MSAELDMTQYIGLFLQEVDEQLAILEQETLKLEQDPSTERLQIIFRAAHTLKGSSRAMGFTHFAELTHEMENVLDQLRNGTLALTTDIANALLGCLDSLAEMKEGIATGAGDAISSGDLVDRLRSFTGTEGLKVVSGTGPAPLDPAVREALTAAKEQAEVYHARFTLDPNCVMKFVRVFMIVNLIQASGEILATVPDHEKLEAEEFGFDFEIYFQFTGDLDKLKEEIQNVSEVAKLTVEPWTPDTSPSGDHLVESSGPPARTEPETSALAGAQPAKRAEVNQTIRVDVARLDALMNLVGELVIDRTRIAQIGNELSSKYSDPNIDALGETVGHIARISADLQDQLMKARMMPIETVFNRFPRVVRDLAQKLDKDVKLELIGGETELDRSVIEVIGDPLLHIIRNCVDHGIESAEARRAAGKPTQGRVTVTARHHENHIVIDIEDDGRGINVARVRQKAVEAGLVSPEAAERLSEKDALQYIFASGLSTAAEVTEVSGRGVGMDIVRSNILTLGGIIELDTEQGVGSKFSLRLPLTLAIIRGLLVQIAETVYVIPLGSVIETLLIGPDQIQTVNQRAVVVIRGITTPLISARQILRTRNAEPTTEGSQEVYVVVVGLAERRVGIIVDRLIGEQEVVIKSLSRYCGDVSGVSGATILGDGNVALIMDVNGVVNGE